MNEHLWKVIAEKTEVFSGRFYLLYLYKEGTVNSDIGNRGVERHGIFKMWILDEELKTQFAAKTIVIWHKFAALNSNLKTL